MDNELEIVTEVTEAAEETTKLSGKQLAAICGGGLLAIGVGYLIVRFAVKPLIAKYNAKKAEKAESEV